MLWQTAISVLVRSEQVVNAQKEPLIHAIYGIGEINQTGMLQFVTIWSQRPSVGCRADDSRANSPDVVATAA
jgi:hypothetical protein